jgi:hypothetical protein
VAEHAAVTALDARRELWDGIYQIIRRQKAAASSPTATH